ncbi:MAG: UDP-glucose 4-epimerase GalE [Caldilineae bacterium]|nr:MAG: UDP-glucose 4-epimerase GalE [Caldilineae bacterium]
MTKKVLVTGGCGYIGSHTVRELQRQNYDVVVFDNLVKGHRAAVRDAPVIVGDLLKPDEIRAVFREHPDIAGVLHFAAYIEVGESMRNPGKYFHNNVQGCVNLLDAMAEAGVRYLVFSSSCAVYGTPDHVPVTEEESYKPESVYGASKRMAEEVMEWYDRLKGIRHTPLRYFNAAGASFDAQIGDAYKPATRILPSLFEYLLGQRDRFFINGNDYPTEDGTCIRDYIHVDDLATAHIAALNYLWNGGESMPFNLGTGRGSSNLEIVNMVREVTGIDFEVEIGPRRPGDATRIWADNTRARKVLGWTPRYGLREIVETDWRWHSTHPRGYHDLPQS